MAIPDTLAARLIETIKENNLGGSFVMLGRQRWVGKRRKRSAALFEGIYIREHYNYDYTSYDQNQVDESVFHNPALFESHDTSRDIDINYSSSIFLILALSKELQNRGYSEADAFTAILNGFLTIHPQDETWEHDFSSFFGLTVEEFYATLPSYSGQTNNELLPSSTLILEQIFTD